MEREYTLRHPVVSGLFYPDSEQDLAQTVEGYLEKVDRGSLARSIEEQTGIPEPLNLAPLVIVAPHAGYIFSGTVQAHSYSLLQGRDLDTAVVVGPAHQVSFKGLSVNLDNAFKTPLGNAEVDIEFAKELTSFDSHIAQNEESHLSEHAIEVQLPFIQKVLPNARIVPILIGDQRWESAVLLKDAVANAVKKLGRRCVLIASTDLSHYHSHVEAVELDDVLINDLKKMDAESLFSNIQSGNSEACGFGGIITGILLSRELGRGKSAVLSYRDSGEVSGDRRRVVGYLSAVMY
jgi:AmmeMemoRadiSam system protein B